MTITHPFHPRRGKRVEVISVRQGADPDLMVKGPDGHHVMIAMSWTDYAGGSAQEPGMSPPLLEVEGLRQAARFIEGLRRDEHNQAAKDER